MGPIVDAGEDQEARERRRLQLADRLATLFVGYLLERPALVRAWEAGAPCPALVPAESVQAPCEPWQRRLWEHIQASLEELAASGGARWVAPHRLLERVPLEALVVPLAVHVVGLSWIGPLYRELLEQLATRCDVHLYRLCPTVGFQEDLPAAWREDPALTGRLPRRRGPRAAAPHGGGSDSGGAAPGEPEEPENALLRLWGRVEREQAALHDALLGGPGGGRLDARHGPPPAPAGTLLGRLQSALLLGAPEAPPDPALSARAGGPAPSTRDDRSLQVLACPGRRREAEAVAGEVWHLLEESAARAAAGAGAPLRLHEVALVLVGEDAPAWLPHLRSAFSEARGLPLSVTGLSLEEPRALEAVRLLLDLPLGPWRREQLLRLLGHENVQAGLPETDPEQWAVWCQALTIVEGRDRADQAGGYLEEDLYNWDQGLRRLALGAFLSGARAGQPDPVRVGAHEYLPLDLPAEQAPAAGRLVLLVRSLLADARFAAEGRRSLAEWGRLLRALVDTYLRPTDPGDEALLGRVAHRLSELGRADAGAGPVSYRAARELAAEALSKLAGPGISGGASGPGISGGTSGPGGRPLVEGVVVGPLERLRGLPFRVVFVLGLDEGRFPARPGADLLDLRLAQRAPGDVTPRERDEQRLLELLCAARERVTLSYLARDPETGDAREPSPVIRQLEAALVAGGLLRPEELPGLTRGRPFRRFDPAHFAPPLGDGPRLPSHLPAAREEARARALGADLRAQLRAALPPGRPLPARASLWRRLSAEARASLTGPLAAVGAPATAPAPDTSLRLPLAALRQFLCAPLQGWARWRLGLLEDEAQDPLLGAEEPFEAPTLGATVLLRRLFLEALAGGEEGFLPRLRARHAALTRRGELAGELPTGPFLERTRARQERVLLAWHAQLRELLGSPLPRLATQRLGGVAGAACDERGAPQVLHPPLELELAGRRVEVHGASVGSAALAREGQAVGLVQLVTGFEVPEHHLLEACLDQAALAAAGVPCADPFRLIVATGGAARRARGHMLMRAFTPAEARAWLGALLEDLLGRAHDYLLPYEAALLFLRQDQGPERLPLEELVRAAADDGWTRLREDWGPVPDPREYDPPPDGEALAARRYGPYLERVRPARGRQEAT